MKLSDCTITERSPLMVDTPRGERTTLTQYEVDFLCGNVRSYGIFKVHDGEIVSMPLELGHETEQEGVWEDWKLHEDKYDDLVAFVSPALISHERMLAHGENG